MAEGKENLKGEFLLYSIQGRRDGPLGLFGLNWMDTIG
jgi:hypothetical protein